MKRRIVSTAALMTFAVGALAGTYSIAGVSVTYAGGTWPSQTYRSNPQGGWGSSGGQVSGSSYVDGFYSLSSSFYVQQGQSIPSSSAIVGYLDRDNITVSYTIQFVATVAGETPSSATGTVDTRYYKEAWAAFLSSGFISTTAAVGIQSGLSYIWDDATYAASIGGGTGGSWTFYETLPVSFGSWTLVAPNTWQATAIVPYDASTIEYDLKTIFWGSASSNRNTGNAVGEWQFRLRSVSAGGSAVVTQPAF